MVNRGQKEDHLNLEETLDFSLGLGLHKRRLLCTVLSRSLLGLNEEWVGIPIREQLVRKSVGVGVLLLRQHTGMDVGGVCGCPLLPSALLQRSL